MNSLKQATGYGVTQQMKVLAPALLYNQRRAGGAAAYEGVIGGANYHWTLEDSVASAKAFNDVYRKENNGAPPSDYGAYGYAGVGALLDGVKMAGGTESDAVVAALEALKYDKYKGTQYYRKCDHQSVQSVLIVESKAESDMADEYDVFNIVHVEEASEDILRSCAELGHEA
jgi:branched-chain amino acid transport system substrate-binding protein